MCSATRSIADGMKLGSYWSWRMKESCQKASRCFGWTSKRGIGALQKLRDAGVSVDLGGTGLFLCPHNELSKAKRQMPANWKALHQDAMHGLEAEVAHYFQCNLYNSFISGGRCCWGPGFAKRTVESGPEASGSGDKQWALWSGQKEVRLVFLSLFVSFHFISFHLTNAFLRWREHGFTNGMYLMADGM